MQGKDGSYGTSLSWHAAMDESLDVILAYKQNGRYLLPDHGAPIRMIIPGYIGGRMVKWLEEITVTEVESDNFYHFHDNRVLPPGIEQEAAKADGKQIKTLVNMAMEQGNIWDINQGAVGIVWIGQSEARNMQSTCCPGLPAALTTAALSSLSSACSLAEFPCQEHAAMSLLGLLLNGGGSFVFRCIPSSWVKSSQTS